ncbi:MAG TPA: ABC transporter permease [Acholeplasma sp.]|nr:ABC transporter permease [Acholeplasma sp.]
MTNQYEKAKVSDYGYKDYSFLKPVGKVFSIVFTVTMLFLLYLPIIVIAIQSVNSSKNTSSFDSFTFEWYLNIFNEPDLLNAISNTFLVSTIATTIATVLGTLFAIGIYNLPKKARSRIMFLNNVPILNADIVTGFSLMIMFRFLMIIFPDIFGLTTLVLAHLFFTLPYVILSVIPKLKELDPNLIDAAQDLGIKPKKAIYLIIVPAIKAGIFSGMILALTMSIDDFVISFFTTGAGYDNLSIWIYGVLGRRNLTPSVYSFSTLLTLFTLIGLITVQLLQRKRKGKKK